jgi:hypothetical protein
MTTIIPLQSTIFLFFLIEKTAVSSHQTLKIPEEIYGRDYLKHKRMTQITLVTCTFNVLSPIGPSSLSHLL